MRTVLVALAIAALFASLNGAWAELKVLDQPLWVFPGQPFRIALEQPAGSGQLRVEFPDNVEMYDQWDKDAIQRLYFRALAAGETALRFSGAGGELELTVEIIPWAALYEPREYQGIKLPRIWPVGDTDFAEVKARRTMHTEQELRELRASGREPSDRARAWLEMSDEEILSIIPGPAIPRTCLLVLLDPGGSRGKGCPVCGTAIYEGRSGFYPWIFDPDGHPWKVGCPNCGTWFPSNDWANGDMHSGPFPDDGFGCEPVEPVVAPNGTPWRWPFIAYYHQWQAYMRTLTPGIDEAALAFAYTGDERYAHKCAIALFRFAQSYLDMSLNLNHRKRVNRDGVPKWPVGAPIKERFHVLPGSFSYIQPNWDTPKMENAARAWDLIFDQVEGDEELIRFCQEHHHPEIGTIEDFRRFIDAGVIRTSAQFGLDNAASRNWPMQEGMVATMALALGTPRSMELTDWVLNKGGAIRYGLANEDLKDGSGHESEGYNGGQIKNMNEIFQTLERIRQLHPDLYQPPQFVSLLHDPQYRQMYDFTIDNSLIGRTITATGDTGHTITTDPWPPRQGHPAARGQFVNVYRLTRDPRFAQVLYGPDGRIPDELTEPELREEVARLGQELGWQVKLPSNILDGYGHAILRSGEGEFQRALWLRYGRCVQHIHWDMLTMGLEALQRKLLPELGYPVGWTYAGVWETNWGTHYGTHITGVRTRDFGRGALELFCDCPPARVAKAVSVTMEGEQPRPRRERVIALVDISERDCYAVTLERVFGGGQHTWSFHGPTGEVDTFGIDLRPQGGGTIAGPDARYRDDSAIKQVDPELACLAFMPDPSRGRVAGTWGLDYLLRDQEDVRLRVTSVHPTDGELATAVCKAPGGRCDYQITWAIWQREGEAPLASQFLTVLEPCEGERVVKSIEPVAVSGGSEGPFRPLAVRVTTNEFVDTLIFQPQPGVDCATQDGITCDTEFAFWRERDGKLASAVLAHGTRLSSDGLGLALSQPRYVGEIESCDWANREITVKLIASPDEPFPEQKAEVTTGNAGDHAVQDVRFVGLSRHKASALVGRHVRLTNEAGSEASYTIQEAQPTATGVELTLNLDPRIGEAFVAGCEDGAVLSGLSFRLASWGYYAGKTLANEDASTVYRLQDVAGRTKCVIDAGREGQVTAADLEKQFADQDGDGTARLVIYDYGPGDTVTIECWAAMSAAR